MLAFLLLLVISSISIAQAHGDCRWGHHHRHPQHRSGHNHHRSWSPQFRHNHHQKRWFDWDSKSSDWDPKWYNWDSKWYDWDSKWSDWDSKWSDWDSKWSDWFGHDGWNRHPNPTAPPRPPHSRPRPLPDPPRPPHFGPRPVPDPTRPPHSGPRPAPGPSQPPPFRPRPVPSTPQPPKIPKCLNDWLILNPNSMTEVSVTLGAREMCTLIYQSSAPMLVHKPNSNIHWSVRGENGFSVDTENYTTVNEYSLPLNFGEKLAIVLVNDGNEMGSFYSVIQTMQLECDCGKPPSGQVHSGDLAKKQEFATFALVVDRSNNEPLCSASIISEKQLLTRVPCILTARSTDLYVVTAVGAPEEISYKIKNIKHENDNLALITVEGSIAFHDFAFAACLPFFPPHQNYYFSSRAEALGYDFTDATLQQKNLLKTNLTVLPMKNCGHKNMDDQLICTKPDDKESPMFQYDTGGPLLLFREYPPRAFLIGITRSVSDVDSRLSTNVRLANSLDWIVENTPPDVQYCKRY